jgi:hypothetical protein
MSKPLLELIFSDVWGPACDSIGRNKYYVSFTDDFSKFIWIYLLKDKSKVFQNSKNSRPLSNDCLTKRLLQFKPIGVVSTKGFINFLVKLVSLTMFHVPMLINKMGQPSINIIT